MLVDSSGRVGIDTTSPIDRFQVAAANSPVGLGEFGVANGFYNGGAEAGSNGWTSRDFGIDGSSGSGTSEANSPLAGSFNFHAVNDGGLNQSLALVPGGVYTVSARVRVHYINNVDASNGYLVVGTTSTARDIVDQACNPDTYDATPTINQWTLCSATFTAPTAADAATTTVFVGFRAAGSTHEADFDNLMLVRGGQVADYSPFAAFGVAGYVGNTLTLPLSRSSTTQYTSTAFLTLTNTDLTDNNWSSIRFADSAVVSSAAEIQTKFTDHANDYGELHLSTRGSGGIATRLLIDSSGKVGIGTTSPSAKFFEVNATNSFTNNTPTAKIYHYNNPDGNQTNVPSLQIQSGITSADALHHGYVSLEQIFTGSATDSPALYLVPRKNVSNDQEWWGWQGVGNDRLRLVYSSTANGTGPSTSPSDFLSINNVGNVGIGVSSVNYKLDVATASSGTQVRFGSSTADSGGFLVSTGAAQGILSGGASWNGANWIAKSTVASQVSADTGTVRFYTDSSLTSGNSYSPSERMRIDSSGNVGIGTTSPSAKLDVPSGAKFNGVAVDDSNHGDDVVLFAPQPYFEAGTTATFPPGWSASIDGFVQQNTTAIPFSKVALSNTFDEISFSDYIPVRPGEKLYGEVWAMRETGATGTAGSLYFGIRRYDKDKLPVASNDGIDYFVASNVTVPTNSTWTKYSGETTLPTSHTPFSGSDGGPVRYVRIILYANYSAGTIPTYWGGAMMRRTELTRDAGTVVLNGNVGINTTSPQAPLHVNGTIRWAGATVAPYIYSNRDAGGFWFEGVGTNTSDEDVRIQTSKSGDTSNYSIFTIDPTDGFAFTTSGNGNGNVGIGTATPTFLTGSGLEIERAGAATLHLEDTGSGGKVFELFVDDAGTATINSASSGLALTLNTVNTERMRIDTSGRVGIGTNSPDTTLIGGSLHISNATDGAGPLLLDSASPDIYFQTSNTKTNWRVAAQEDVDQGFTIGTGSTDATAADDTYTARLTIEDGGDVGVGTTNPNSRFEIADSSSSTSQYTSTELLQITNTDQTANNWATIGFMDSVGGAGVTAIQTKYTDHTNNYGELHFSTRGASGLGSRLVIDTAGNVGIGTASPASELHVFNTSGSALPLYLERNTNTNGQGVGMNFRLRDSGSNNTDYARIFGVINSNTDGSEQGRIDFLTNNAGVFSTVMVIDHLGKAAISSNNLLAPATRLHLRESTTTGPLGLTIENDGASTSDLNMFRIISEVGGADNVKARIDSDGDLFLDGAITASSATITVGSADFAEDYSVIDDADVGHIVSTAGGETVKKSEGSYDKNILGVISTKPGLTLSMRDENGAPANPNPKPVALVGRVPVKVSMENGPINVGDFLTSSSTPGIAMKATNPGVTIGRALEAASQDGTTLVFVNTGWFDGADQTLAANPLNNTTLTSDLNVNGKLLLNVRGIIGLNWSITEDGKLVSKEIETDKVTTKEVVVRKTDQTKTVGEAKILAGSDSVRVENSLIKPTTKVFLTVKGNPKTFWWLDETGDGYFVVRTEAPVAADIVIDYWLVGVLDETTPPPPAPALIAEPTVAVASTPEPEPQPESAPITPSDEQTMENTNAESSP